MQRQRLACVSAKPLKTLLFAMAHIANFEFSVLLVSLNSFSFLACLPEP